MIWVFLADQFGKYRFFDIFYKKEGFLDQKKKVQKSPKNRIFPKGLLHGFCRKIELFIMYVFLANQARQDHFLIFWIKKVCY